MKNVSRICLGLITIFSITACGKGSKVAKEDFFEEVANIKSDKYKKAKITLNEIIKTIEENNSVEEKTKSSGSYAKDETGSWKTDSETNGSNADSMYRIISEYHLSVIINNFDSFVYGEKQNEKFYIKPFSYDAYTKREGEYEMGVIYDNSLKEARSPSTGYYKYATTTQFHYEWNDYGYLTNMEYKTETKGEYTSTNQKVTSSRTINVKISYK